MGPISRSLSVLLLGTTLLACGDDVTTEDHVRKAEILLEESRTQIKMVRESTEYLAIAELKAALKKDGDNAEVNRFLGTIYFEQGAWEGADAKLSKALTLGADPSAIVPMLAQILLSIGELKRLDSLSFDGLDPNGRSTVQSAKALSMIYRGKPVLAAEIMEAALQNEPVSVFVEVAAARVAMDIDGYDEARRQLKEILKRYPEYVPAWKLLGDVESVRGQPKAALQAYKTVSTLSGDKFQVLLNGALMQIYTGDVKRARRDLNTVYEKYRAKKEHEGVRFAQALVHLKFNQLYRARQIFQVLSEETDVYPLSLYYLAAIDLELGVIEFESGFSELALNRVYQFLGAVPDSVAGVILAAKIELGRGDFKKAEKLLQPLLNRRPDEIEAVNLLARAQIGQGRNQEGIQYLARVVELQPELMVAKARLAAAYLDLGSEELGQEMLPDIVSQDLDPPRVDISGNELADSKQMEKPVLSEHSKRPDDLDILDLRNQLAQGSEQEDNQVLARIDQQSDSLEAEKRLGTGYPGMASEELGIAILQGILSEDPGYEQADVLIVLNALRQRRITDAIRAAQAYRERNPSGATAYDLLGRAYLENGENQKAKAAFGKALELRPGDPVASNGLAEFELLENDYDSARKYYDQTLRRYPGHMQTWKKLAASFAEEGREEEMRHTFRNAVLADPRALEPRLAEARFYLARGQLDEAALLLGGLTEQQQEHPDAMVTRAAWELTAGRYDQALITLRMLIRMRPNVSQYHYMRAKAYAGLGDKKRLVAELERAAELDPSHFYTTIAKARLEIMSGKIDAFEKHLAKLKAIAPDNLDVMKLEVLSRQRKGNSQIASQLLESIFRQQPATSNVIALAAHRQQLGDFKGAIEEVLSWLKNHPEDLAAREKLAELYGRSDQTAAAIEQYSMILDDAPEHITSLNNLSWHLLNDEPDEALEYAEKAIHLSPRSSQILDTLAMAQLKNNKILAARRSIDRARVIAPDSPELLFHDAQILAAEGDEGGAMDALQDLLSESGNFSGRAEAESYLKRLN